MLMQCLNITLQRFIFVWHFAVSDTLQHENSNFPSKKQRSGNEVAHCATGNTGPTPENLDMPQILI